VVAEDTVAATIWPAVALKRIKPTLPAVLTLLVTELPIVVVTGDPKALQPLHGGVTAKYVL